MCLHYQRVWSRAGRRLQRCLRDLWHNWGGRGILILYKLFQFTNTSWADELNWLFMRSSDSLGLYFYIELSNFMHERDCCFPALRDTRGYLRELTSRRVFPGCSGWIKNVSFFFFVLHIARWLFVDAVVCVRSVFSSTASSTAPTCFWPPRATNVVDFWTQNQSVFFLFIRDTLEKNLANLPVVSCRGQMN